MNNKKKLIIIVVIAILIICVGIVVTNILTKKKDVTEGTTISDINFDVNTDDDDAKIDWTTYDTADVELTGNLTITKNAVYNISGTLDNGLIKVNTSGNVKLILNNVSIKNSSGPAIYIEKAEDVVIELVGDNYLEDGSSYNGYDSEENGVIFSHDDLTIQGDGSLTIKSNYQDGIVSKDDLKFVSGTYNIESVDDSIRGTDSVYIQNGTFIINSGADGIKSTNEKDSDKGFILIENGTFKINSSFDAMQAETILSIKDGSFDITTGGGASISSSTSEEWGNWNNKYKGQGQSTKNKSSDSAKGLKAGGNLVISGGKFNLNTSDDSIHSNNYFGLNGGELIISSGDDGIHADTEIVIDKGNVDIKKSYEGIESAKMTINGGTISLVSQDDGINVAGGNDSSSMNRPGANGYSENSKNILTINGGTINVDASGDGIDINGSGYINGGTITVNGPTNSGNGALDYDGTLQMTGGSLIAAGASGMSQGLSQSSTQYYVSIGFTQTISSTDKVTIENEKGTVILSFSSTKSYSNLVFASDKLEKNKTYIIKINGTEYTKFTTISVSTSVGNSGYGNQGHGGQGGRGH